MMTALKESKRGHYFRQGDMGALRLCGKTSLEEDIAGAGVLGLNKLG